MVTALAIFSVTPISTSACTLAVAAMDVVMVVAMAITMAVIMVMVATTALTAMATRLMAMHQPHLLHRQHLPLLHSK